MEYDHKRNAEVFKAFSDENRLKILEMLRSGEKCACILLEKMNITQPTLSHHMKILCGSGIVVSRRDGKWVHYSINNDVCRHAAELLRLLTAAVPEELREKDCC